MLNPWDCTGPCVRVKDRTSSAQRYLPNNVIIGIRKKGKARKRSIQHILIGQENHGNYKTKQILQERKNFVKESKARKCFSAMKEGW